MRNSYRSAHKEISPEQKREQLFVGFLCSFSLLLLVVFTLYLTNRTIQQNIYKEIDRNQIAELRNMSSRLHSIFSRIEDYLIHVPQMPFMQRVFLHGDPQARDEAELVFAGIIEANVRRFAPSFAQLRLLDLKGMEIIRVDLADDNRALIVQQENLQDKSRRYYYRDSVNLAENEIYMSPLDLNIEKGRIEVPHKPMIRFVTPVFNENGKKLGTFVINFLAQQIFNELDEINIHEGDKWILLNKDGYYLRGPFPEKDFGFMFSDRQIGFFSDYPELWQKLSNNPENKYKQSDGLYYKAEIVPFTIETLATVNQERSWTLLMFVPDLNIQKRRKPLTVNLIAGGALFGTTIITLGWFLGVSRVKNKWYIKALKESATIDSLTDLLNHRAVMEKLEYLVNHTKRSGQPLSLAFIDLNDLKLINDTLGHKGGDQMIVAVAQSIQQTIRNTDIAARAGGDEFLIIFPGLTNEHSRDVIQRIEHLYTTKSSELFSGRKFTLSWGVSHWQGGADSIESLIARADSGMYQMKRKQKEERKQRNR